MNDKYVRYLRREKYLSNDNGMMDDKGMICAGASQKGGAESEFFLGQN